MATRIENGIYVNIRRSDGRVHNAIVTSFNKETEAVSVEWFEEGETKGKEISLKVLLDTNPTLRANDESAPVPAVRTSIARPSPVQQPAPVAAPTQNGIPKPNALPRPPKSTSNLPVRQSVDRRSLIEPLIEPAKVNRALAAVHPVAKSDEPEEHTIIARPAAPKAPVTAAPAPSKITAPAPTSTSNGVGRKSSFSSYQEKMNHSRVERRANQEEQKKMREHQKNIDPGNKNWQFLSMIREYQQKVDFKTLSMSDLTSMDSRIVVCVRKRPMNKSEISGQEVEVVTIPNKDHLVIHKPDVKYDLTKSIDNQTFRFDCVFDENIDNDMVYRFTAQPLVNVLFDGGHATVFAYGQTGSGKTHTMGGEFRGKDQDASNGLYAYTAADVFRLMKTAPNMKKGLKVYCSFFELYGDRTFDLLAQGEKTHLRVMEDGHGKVNIVGLREIPVQNEAEVIKLIKAGSKNRFAGKTSANSCSSRSHAIFQIILKDKKEKVYGKFSIVDLAGSERGADTTASDAKTRIEGAAINTSLLALKECIRAMNAKQDRAPFRQSKLTLVLRDSFVHEKGRTCMIAMISPGLSSCEHTLNTLHYANRVKELGVEDGSVAKPISPEEFMTADNDSDADLTCETIESEINANEGAILDKTLDLIDGFSAHRKKYLQLAEMANQADYDMDKFAKQMKSQLGSTKKELMGILKELEARVDDFTAELKSERELIRR